VRRELGSRHNLYICFVSEKYKVRDIFRPHFITVTVTQWVDLFTRNEYRQIILDSLVYCQKQKGLIVHAWVIMHNHLHLIVGSTENRYLPNTVRDFKKFTSVALARAIASHPQESRREWLLGLFAAEAATSAKHEKYQIWQEGYHPIELNDA
jgi:putative transposase